MVKELEDYDWFPRVLRKQQLEFIGNVVKWFKIYQPLVPVLRQQLEQNKLSRITDCCSGSGEPAVWIHGQLQGMVPTTLTDKFPQAVAAEVTGVVYKKESCDVTRLLPVKDNLYTMYNAFHHFSTNDQQKILQQLASSRASFLFAEVLQPGIVVLLKTLFTSTIGQLLLAPFVQPFSVTRLLLTYLLPVNIVTVTYDGIISVLKSKTAAQYRQLTAGISQAGYSITVSTVKGNGAKIVYITGTTLHK